MKCGTNLRIEITLSCMMVTSDQSGLGAIWQQQLLRWTNSPGVHLTQPICMLSWYHYDVITMATVSLQPIFNNSCGHHPCSHLSLLPSSPDVIAMAIVAPHTVEFCHSNQSCTSFLFKHTMTSSYCTHTHAWSPTLTSHSKGCNCVHSHNTDKVVGEVTDGKT